MEYKKLGKSELKVSVIGLGTGFRSGLTKDSAEVIRRTLDLGLNLIDTAEVYHSGRAEEVVGEVVRGRREDAIIVTKVSGEHLKYEDVLKAAEGSLKRLGIDTIDLYLVHWPNPRIPIGETMRAMERLVKDGKVRYIGVSNFNVAQVKEAREALSRYDLVANEVIYNIIERGIEDEILPYCQREHIEIIAYSPLARGLFTGKLEDSSEIPVGHWRSKDRLFQQERLAPSLKLVRTLTEIGSVHGKTPGQVALNWVIAKPRTIAIFGASNKDQVVENIGATRWRLTTEEIEKIENASKDLISKP